MWISRPRKPRQALRRECSGAGLALLLLASAVIDAAPSADRIPNSLTIPQPYPDSSVFVFEAGELILGAFALIDVAAESRQYQGQVQGAGYGSSLLEARLSPHLYVTETIYARGAHGARSDLLTIYDKGSLAPVSEIILPGHKRALMGGGAGRMRLTGDGQLALVFNFTPAASVSVVNVQQRTVVNEIPVPGCTLIYPTGVRGFFSLCANGSLVSLRLDEAGRVLEEWRSERFNEIDGDVLYMEPATIAGVTYFVTKQGNVRPIRTAGDTPEILPGWPLMSRAEREEGWRTADGTFVASDAAARLYVRVRKEAQVASAKAKTEVWGVDVSTQQRRARIPLKNGASSIEVTRGARPYLVTVAETEPTAYGGLDVYEATTGAYLRSIGNWRPGVYLWLVRARQ